MLKLHIPDHLTNRFIPNLNAVSLLEYFLVSAVSSLLVIRVFLNITGFPQIGGGNFHIAHMLWGGLCMVIANILFITFINNRAKVIGAVLSGVGFGTFIDELGKFITADNNYFYQPTIALIYVIFVGLFFLVRMISRISEYSSKTYLANALEGLKEYVVSDLDEHEKRLTLQYLKKTYANNDTARLIRQLITSAQTKPALQSYYDRVLSVILTWYKKQIKRTVISRLLLSYFIITTIISFVASMILFIYASSRSVAEIGFLISTTLASMFVAHAAIRFVKRDVGEMYNSLQKAALISIFLSQFFLFLDEELSAIGWLLLYISVYVVLNISAHQHQLDTSS